MVDEDVDRIPVELLQFGLGDEARDSQKPWVWRSIRGLALPWRRLRKSCASEVDFGRGGQHQRRRIAPENLEQPVSRRSYRWSDQEGLGRRMQFKVARWMRQRVVGYQRGNVREFGLFRLEELAPRRRVVEEIANGDGCASGHPGVVHAEDIAAGDLDGRACGILVCAGLERQPRNARNRRQRLAAEA